MEPEPQSWELIDDTDFVSHTSKTVERWRDGRLVHAIDQVIEEVPVAMVYNGISHAVMLATPVSLKQFALGFSLSEGILNNLGELYDFEVLRHKDGIEVQMSISQARFSELKQRRRNLAGRTGCGLCGTESLQQVQRKLNPIVSGQQFSPQAIHNALADLPRMQSLQSITGAVHAAVWVAADGAIRHAEEDIGRHNALDKLIGTLAIKGEDTRVGFAVVTSRASYEMVQKVVTAGIPMLVAVSAPTGMAVELAEQYGLTLAGFARGASHVVYANSYRISY